VLYLYIPIQLNYFMQRGGGVMKKTRVINIRLTEEQRMEIDSLAELMQTTRTEVLLKAIAYLKDHMEEVLDDGKR
jgi:uncharacterized protein (DUF1778 family)